VRNEANTGAQGNKASRTNKRPRSALLTIEVGSLRHSHRANIDCDSMTSLFRLLLFYFGFAGAGRMKKSPGIAARA
jgi:hypothetical protein